MAEMNDVNKQDNNEKEGMRGKFVRLKQDMEASELVTKLLKVANSNSKGKDIDFSDLCIFALKKLKEEDVQDLIVQKLTPREIFLLSLEKAHEEHLKKGGKIEDLWEFALQAKEPAKKFTPKSIQ